MDKFLEYVSKFDSDFHKSLKGATPAQIDQLEQLVGRPLPIFPSKRDFTSSFDSIEEKIMMGPAIAIAADFGFKSEWFSDSVQFLGLKPGAAISISQYEDSGVSMTISANKKDEVDKIGSVMINKIGVHRI